MLWIFVVAIIMPISLANCDDNLATIKWDHAVNSKSKLDAALKSDIQFIEADVILGKTTGSNNPSVAVQAPEEEGGDAAAQAAQAVADNLPKNAAANKGDAKEDKKDGDKKTDKKQDGDEDGKADGDGNGNDDIPVMAHSASDTTDLSLEEFLKTVADYNEKNSNSTKGVKLDFKSIGALEKSIDLLKKEVKAPLWINSDILNGPIESKGPPVDAKKFFAAVKGGQHLNGATLSIGWTTTTVKGTKGNYTEKHVEEMIKTIDENIKGSSYPITFPVRALFAAESKDTLRKLYDHVSKEKKEKVTFTVWSSAGDEVDKDKLQDFISSFGVKNVYVDVPKSLKDELKLDSGAASIAAFGLINVVAVLVALFLRNGLH